MSILAGAIIRRRDRPLPDSVRQALKHLLTCRSDAVVDAYQDEYSWLGKIDVQAYQQTAFLTGEGCVAMVVGDPDLDIPPPSQRTRTSDLTRLQAAFKTQDWTVLRHAQGIFAAAFFDAQTRRFTLIADKLGLRPVYYWADDSLIVFASALRILEGIPCVPKRADLRALTEINTLGYPLADRTPYYGIVRLRAGGRIEFDDTRTERSYYWRWDEIPESSQTEQELLLATFHRFRDNIRRSLGSDRAVLASLSGGLDSRCVVSLLRDCDAHVHTVTFASGNSQDRAFAAQYAQAAGTSHHEFPYRLSPDVLVEHLVGRIQRTISTSPLSPERPRLLWSGSGGSVGVGCVYINSDTAVALHAGKQEEAVEAFIRYHRCHPPLRLFQSKVHSALCDIPREGILSELNLISSEDLTRKFYLFLMLNDQRWHLSAALEDVDLHGIEQHAPFYSGHFLETVLAARTEWLLFHRFYHRWLSCFPATVTAVPWQTYPEHEPCPLPAPDSLSNQWEAASHASSKGIRTQELLSDLKKVFADGIPDPMSAGALRSMLWLHRLRLRDYTWALEAARSYGRHLQVSGGNWRVSPLA